MTLREKIDGFRSVLEDLANERATCHELSVVLRFMAELSEQVEALKQATRSAANVAGCLANGMKPD